MKQPTITIIIPVLNNLAGLQLSVESIQKQIYVNYEVWIIDGGSAAETQNYLKTLSLPFQYKTEKDKGIYDAMNKGIDMAKGKWLYFLGSGDIFYNKNVLANTFNKKISTNFYLISGCATYNGHTNPFIYNKKKRIKKPTWSSFIWIWNGLHHQATFYRKELFEEIQFNQDYSVLSDYWFNILLYKKNYQCKLLSHIISICDSNGISKQGKWKDYTEEIKLKTSLSYWFLRPFFYFVALTKFWLRKI